MLIPLGIVAAQPATPLAATSVEYLVIAGGGGGGNGFNWGASGGGAGGYRTSVSGQTSGGNSVAEDPFVPDENTSYTITVGAGGFGRSSAGEVAQNGGNSVFATIVSIGGGGGSYNIDASTVRRSPSSGGSGAGVGVRNIAASSTFLGGLGDSAQGFNGGAAISTRTNGGGGVGSGGGGAGGPGLDATVTAAVFHAASSGGVGLSNDITGVSVFRGGGGGGAANNVAAAGGQGGGGNGVFGFTGGTGAANTGGGGGGSSNNQGYFSGRGGSGIVIIRYPSTFRNLTQIDPGLVWSFSTNNGFKIYQFTAGTGSIRF